MEWEIVKPTMELYKGNTTPNMRFEKIQFKGWLSQSWPPTQFFLRRHWKKNPEKDKAQKPTSKSVSDQIVGPGQQGQMWLKGLWEL